LPGRPDGLIGKIVGIGALVLALAGAGFVGWQVFGPAGGADSPEAAASEFVAGVTEQDGIGVLKMVAPGEVSGFDDVYSSLQDRLEEAGLTDGSSISGAIDIEVDNLEFDVDELSENAARVELTSADYTVTYDPAELPDELDFVADQAPREESWSGDLVEEFENETGVSPTISTVKVDGRWYITLIGTGLDYAAPALEDEGYSSPNFDDTEELEPITGSDPEEVVNNLVDAINSLDVEDALANLPADLIVGLRPYARTFESALRDNDIEVAVTAEDLDLEEEDLGDGLIKVTINEATFSGYGYNGYGSGGGSLDVYDAECFEALGEEYYDDYTGETYQDEERGCLSDVSELGDVGIEEFFVVMREVDGGYQLDPVATAFTYANEVIENFPDSFIDDILEEIEDSGDIEGLHNDTCDEVSSEDGYC